MLPQISRLSSRVFRQTQRYSSTVSALDFKPTNTAEPQPLLKANEAIEVTKASAKAKFDETIEVAIKLGVDPRKPNQSVRGVVKMPHGTGKQVRVAVFARGEKAEEAKAAGATVVGAEDLVKQIQDGSMDFDRCIATPDMMPLVGRVARILGPRGLMPNPKLGSVTQDVETAIKDMTAGQVEFRADKFGFVRAGIAKVSFSEEAILENLRAFMVHLVDVKPEGAKGKYIQQAHVSSTMGKAKALNLHYIDPSNAKFMRFDI